MKAYWLNLTDRERWTAIAGAIFCIAYLIYIAIYAPLDQAIDAKKAELAEKKATLTWMEQVRGQAHDDKRRLSVSGSELLTLLASQLKKTTFASFPYELQQRGTLDSQLSFKDVPYNACMAWLHELSTHYTVSVKQLTVDSGPVDGVVTLTVVLG